MERELVDGVLRLGNKRAQISKAVGFDKKGKSFNKSLLSLVKVTKSPHSQAPTPLSLVLVLQVPEQVIASRAGKSTALMRAYVQLSRWIRSVLRVLLRPLVAGEVFVIPESPPDTLFRRSRLEWFLMRFEMTAKARGLVIRT